MPRSEFVRIVVALAHRGIDAIVRVEAFSIASLLRACIRTIVMRELGQNFTNLQSSAAIRPRSEQPDGCARDFERAGDAFSNTLLRAFIAAAFVFASMVSARAQSPVALVEEVNSKIADVDFMDYLAVGKIIRLGPQDTIVLEYMRSCWREAIAGGTVTVGAEQSDVQGGKVDRRKVDCDGGKLMLSAQQASQSAGMVFRDMRVRKPISPLTPQITLYGSSPMIELKGGGRLMIERIDQPGERHDLSVASDQLVKGAFYDLTRAGQVLVAGGIYRAIAGGQQLIFQIDANAKPEASPIIGRLLRLKPTS